MKLNAHHLKAAMCH